ncbi:ABC transporter substrate-binding protein [Nostoc sp. FACHB-888]|uniref:ABC transporter substrate-binding protein n=1 Tax=Nostoc sp. FACHB-888 TaxID=2692842 RepID=UPI00168972F9|nr:ABC transporter substrate-binding protein [Nostoc sp. FACHB-888]MBD2246556.1 ABC transporter substrate-binding protein [Nostoc sp. FACHB-888]
MFWSSAIQSNFNEFKGQAKVLPLALLLLTLLMACKGTNTSVNEPEINKILEKNTDKLAVLDQTNTKISVNAIPKRIVCLDTFCIDILNSIGLEPVALLAHDESVEQKYFQEQGNSKFIRIGGSWYEPNLEDIAKVKPDLVIGSAGIHDGLRNSLKSIVPLYLMYPYHYTALIKNVEKIGELTERSQQAKAAAEKFRSKLAAYQAKSPNNQTVILINGDGTNFYVQTKKAIECSTLAEVAKCPWGESSQAEGPLSTYIQYSLEQIIKNDPDVIFMLIPNSKEQLEKHPLWRELKAVKNKRVYEVEDPVIWNTHGLRSLSLVLDEVMPKLYPEVFPEPLP